MKRFSPLLRPIWTLVASISPQSREARERAARAEIAIESTIPPVSDDGPGEITELLNVSGEADGEGPMTGDRLWELVYPELRRRAQVLFAGERSGGSLSATAVVNEAFMRLADSTPREWKDRSHFYAVSSGIMRHVLVDHARARIAAKRGGGVRPITLDESVFPSVAADEAGFEAAKEALEKLAVKHERASLVVAMHVFGGLTFSEIASELGVSERTAKADWMIARVKLREALT
jgi:RNA polymerase sigma factor (TIGR02999 family)